MSMHVMCRADVWLALWRERSARERRLVALGLAVLAPLAFYLYVWQPLTVRHDRLSKEVARLSSQVEVMRHQVNEIQRLRLQPPMPAAGSFAEAVREVAKRMQLQAHIAEWQQQTDGRLHVRLRAAPAPRLAEWLGELALAGARIERCELRALGSSDGIEAQLVLARVQL